MGAAERSGVRGIPVVAFAGYSGSGKTTVIAALIPHLRRRGLRVAVVKHAAHSFDMSHPGKDSWQFSQAGAEVSVISSRSRPPWLSGGLCSWQRCWSGSGMWI